VDAGFGCEGGSARRSVGRTYGGSQYWSFDGHVDLPISNIPLAIAIHFVILPLCKFVYLAQDLPLLNFSNNLLHL
jgi:hypothetical protein